MKSWTKFLKNTKFLEEILNDYERLKKLEELQESPKYTKLTDANARIANLEQDYELLFKSHQDLLSSIEED